MRTPLAAWLLVVLSVAACTGGAGSPSPSASGSPLMSSPAASAGQGAVDSVEEAAERVLAQDPRFEDLEPFDADMIGACCWYEAREVDGGYEVAIEIGWGDCPAGCINKHTWLYAVAPSGEVRLIEEAGPSLEPGVVPGDQ